MQVPILKQGCYLVATLQAALTDKGLKELHLDLSDRVGRFRSKGVIVDITVLDVIDSYATRTLRGIAETVLLRGAEMVIVGIQPDVAFSMVQMGLNFRGVETALDLEEGIMLLEEKLQNKEMHG